MDFILNQIFFFIHFFIHCYFNILSYLCKMISPSLITSLYYLSLSIPVTSFTTLNYYVFISYAEQYLLLFLSAIFFLSIHVLCQFTLLCLFQYLSLTVSIDLIILLFLISPSFSLPLSHSLYLCIYLATSSATSTRDLCMALHLIHRNLQISNSRASSMVFSVCLDILFTEISRYPTAGHAVWSSLYALLFYSQKAPDIQQ